MRYPLDELLDRRSIIQLKIERIADEEKQRLKQQYKDYTRAIEEYVEEGTCTREQVEEWHNRLYGINSQIWDLEADMRQGKEGKLSLEEIGKRASQIRDRNRIRVGIKNEIVETCGLGYKDVKINHVSANL